MDRNKYSAIAHRHHTFYNPMNPDKIDKVIELLSLAPEAVILDIGSGKGEILLRIIEKYGCHAVANEPYGEFTEQMRANAQDRGILRNLEIVQEDAKIALRNFPAQTFDVGVCIGSTHALGGYRETLATLTNIVKSGGYLVLGELYWKQKPCEEYLERFGSKEEDLLFHSENVLTAEQFGLTPLWASVASEDDWDAYEWLYSMSIENYCRSHPQDPDTPAMLDRIRSWREIFLKWGRDTLGFGLYVFRRK